MALETLRGLDSVGGFKVVEIFERKDGKFQVDYTDGTQCPVMINHCENSVTFFLQKGPVKEVGVNGCQVDTMIEFAWKIINNFNEAYPCKENNDALRHLHEALVALDNRKNRRISQGIEGTSEEIK